MAVALYRQGLSTREVAEQIGCAPASVSRWNAAFERDGPGGLAAKPQSGGQSRLSKRELERLVRILLKGARAYGFSTELWTLRRVQHVIEQEYAISYHVGHLWRVLRELGFSAQKPARRAREQDEAAVQAFRERDWPAIKKKRRKKAAASS
jgi:transposase